MQLPASGHVVIEASAGTGKTYTLERLVVDLVVDGGAEIDAILVVTFTEKATFELKLRVRRALAEVARGGETLEARTRAATALRGLGGASISTIHAFCQRILQEHAFASGRALTETAVDGARVLSRAFRQAVRARIATMPDGAKLFEAWLARFSLESLEKVLADALRARLFDPATGEGAPFGPAFDAAEVARCLEALPPEPGWALAVETELRPVKAVHASTRAAIVDRLGKLERMLERFRVSGDLLGLVLEVEADRQLFVPFHKKPYEGTVALPPIAAGLGKAVQALEAILPTHQSLAVHLFLPPVREEIEADKRRAAVFDFDDMLSLVGRALEGPDGARLRSTLRERYRFALIDEFQDTDVVQWRIFKALFFDASEGHRLFLVGDPKQAIYGFRGADLEAYLGACREVAEAGGETRRLERSFRSTAALVEALGVLYDDAAPHALLTGEVRHGPPLGCGRPDRFAKEGGAPVVPVVLLEAEAGPTATTVPAAVAAEISALLRAPLEVGDKDGTRRVGPADVFVLTRTEDEGLRVGEALRQLGVPYAFYKQGGLFRTDEAEELHTLLGAIADPASTPARMRALLTDFFALPPEAAPELRAAGATDAVTERLWAWHAQAARGDLEGTLRRAIDESGVVRRLLLGGGGERRLVNLRHLVELLGAEAHRTGATLEDLEMTLGAWIAGRAAPAGVDGDVQRLERERDAVQIMTVHKSKGLEAEIVFLAGGFSAGRMGALDAYHVGAERRVQVGRARDPAIAAAITAERRGEDERLLYVALTRARSRLYLPWTAERSRGPDTLWERLRPRLEELDIDGVRFERRPPRAPAAAALQATRAQPTSSADAYAEPDMSLAGVLASRPHFGVTSYTRLKRAEAPPPTVAARPADDPLPGGAQTGIFLHALLEAVPLETLAGRPALETWQARPEVARILLTTARRHGFDAALVPRAAALVHTALSARLPLDPALACLAEARQEREMELLYPLPRHASGQPRGFVRGFVDLVFEHDGKLWVLDWKSDLLGDYGDAALDAHVTAHYALQARLYAIGVARLCEANDEATYEARFGGLVYAFLRGMRADGEASPGVWRRRPSWAELCRWNAELDEVRA